MAEVTKGLVYLLADVYAKETLNRHNQRWKHNSKCYANQLVSRHQHIVCRSCKAQCFIGEEAVLLLFTYLESGHG